MKHWKLICLSILFLKFNLQLLHGQPRISFAGYSKCPAFKQMVQVVDKCPTTEAEVNEAAEHKNCSFYAQRQNCSDPSVFKYHCVINGYINTTVSVCAPVQNIFGFCTMYSFENQRIEGHLYLPCTHYTPSCPTYYPSTDAYKYPSCYENVYVNQAKLTKTTTVYKDDGSKASTISIIIGALVMNVSLFFVCVVSLILFKRRKRNRQESSYATVTESVPLVLNDGITKAENSEATGKPQINEDNEASVEEGQYQRDIKPTKLKHNVEEEGRNPAGMLISLDTATDTSLLILRKDEEALAEENLEDTKRYLRNYKTFDKYYVETGLFIDAKHLIEKNGVVIITGPPGCGKTIAAVHLMLVYAQKKNWDIRKISVCKDFSFIRFSQSRRNILFFIDNLSFENSFFYELEEWWKELDCLFNHYIKRYTGMHLENKVQLLITARSNAIEKACKCMKWIPPVFKEDYFIDVAFSSASIKMGRKVIYLTDKEKEDIFSGQLHFAKHELQLDFQSFDEKFMEEIKLAEGPIGFPLCAHLYACKKEYRKRGSRFFTHPIDILRIQIEKEIESDSSNRTGTVFFLLFLYEWHLKTNDSHYTLNIRNSESCRTFLEKISKNLLDQFSELNFDQLENTGKRLTGAFLREMEVGKSIFRFTHDSVFDALGTYFCDKYLQQTVQWFPLEVLLNQEFLSLGKEKCYILALRFLYESFNHKLAQVFSCSVFRQESFADAFMKELSKRKRNLVEIFFNLNDDHAGLPVTFWSSKNNLHYLTMMMLSLINDTKIDYEYHLFMSLLGECASRNENIMKEIKSNMHRDELKKIVATFHDDNGDSILHIIIESPRRDEDASELIKTLIKTKGMNINHRNRRNITPVMEAVRCSIKRTKLIEELVKANAQLKYKDINGSTVFHHCLSSENDDRKCSEIITLLLESQTLKKINTDDNKGETPLNIAAKQHRYSRILSILALLKSNEIATNTSNLDGCSPIHNTLLNLLGDDALISLERCARLVIFVVYGVNPEHQADLFYEGKEYEEEDRGVGKEGKESKPKEKGKESKPKEKGIKAIDMCREFELKYEENILLSDKDQNKMADILADLLNTLKTKPTSDEEYEVQNPGNKLTGRLLKVIEETVKLLARKKFD